jgi:hypothetical protein
MPKLYIFFKIQEILIRCLFIETKPYVLKNFPALRFMYALKSRSVLVRTLRLARNLPGQLEVCICDRCDTQVRGPPVGAENAE